jgi:L-fucose isomerase-like protein
MFLDKEKRDAQIRSAYQCGKSIKEISKQFNLSVPHIYRIIRKIKQKERRLNRLKKIKKYIAENRRELKKHKVWIYNDKIYCLKNGEEKSLLACKRCIWFFQKNENSILCCFNKMLNDWLHSYYLTKF